MAQELDILIDGAWFAPCLIELGQKVVDAVPGEVSVGEGVGEDIVEPMILALELWISSGIVDKIVFEAVPVDRESCHGFLVLCFPFQTTFSY